MDQLVSGHLGGGGSWTSWSEGIAGGGCWAPWTPGRLGHCGGWQLDQLVRGHNGRWELDQSSRGHCGRRELGHHGRPGGGQGIRGVEPVGQCIAGAGSWPSRTSGWSERYGSQCEGVTRVGVWRLVGQRQWEGKSKKSTRINFSISSTPTPASTSWSRKYRPGPHLPRRRPFRGPLLPLLLSPGMAWGRCGG